MTGRGDDTGRISARQALGWGLALLAVLVLIFLFFRYGSGVRPILEALERGPWRTSLS